MSLIRTLRMQSASYATSVEMLVTYPKNRLRWGDPLGKKSQRLGEMYDSFEEEITVNQVLGSISMDYVQQYKPHLIFLYPTEAFCIC